MVRRSFQKIQVQKRVLISKIRAGRLGGKSSRQEPQVDRPVDLGVDMLDPSRQPCRLGGRLMVAGQFGLVHLFSVLARFLGLVRNLMVQVDPRVNLRVLTNPNLYK